jgi:hypothetical protein
MGAMGTEPPRKTRSISGASQKAYWQVGPAGDSSLQFLQDVAASLAAGRDVAAKPGKDSRPMQSAEAAGDLLLGFIQANIGRLQFMRRVPRAEAKAIRNGCPEEFWKLGMKSAANTHPSSTAGVNAMIQEIIETLGQMRADMERRAGENDRTRAIFDHIGPLSFSTSA